MPLANDPRFTERASRPADASAFRFYETPPSSQNPALPVWQPGSTVPDYVHQLNPQPDPNFRVPFLSRSQVEPLSAETSAALRRLPGYGQPIPGGSGVFSTLRIFEQSTGAYVNFAVTPEVSESKSVNYIEISEIRQAASILVFIGSPGRNFTVNAKLVSRTSEEADANFSRLNLLKSWAKPDKGGRSRSAGSPSGNGIDTSAPTILYMYGYGRLMKGIQIVMKSINVDYPTDTDYVQLTGDPKTRMPIIMPVSMTFQEIRSAQQLAQFDLSAYKLGQLERW